MKQYAFILCRGRVGFWMHYDNWPFQSVRLLPTGDTAAIVQFVLQHKMLCCSCTLLSGGCHCMVGAHNHRCAQLFWHYLLHVLCCIVIVKCYNVLRRASCTVLHHMLLYDTYDNTNTNGNTDTNTNTNTMCVWLDKCCTVQTHICHPQMILHLKIW
jgi:hypothetical protein